MYKTKTLRTPDYNNETKFSEYIVWVDGQLIALLLINNTHKY